MTASNERLALLLERLGADAAIPEVKRLDRGADEACFRLRLAEGEKPSFQRMRLGKVVAEAGLQLLGIYNWSPHSSVVDPFRLLLYVSAAEMAVARPYPALEKQRAGIVERLDAVCAKTKPEPGCCLAFLADLGLVVTAVSVATPAGVAIPEVLLEEVREAGLPVFRSGMTESTFWLSFVVTLPDGAEQSVLHLRLGDAPALEADREKLLKAIMDSTRAWLPPALAIWQVALMPIGVDKSGMIEALAVRWKEAGIRLLVTDPAERLGTRIKGAILERIRLAAIIGEAEIESKTMRLRDCMTGQQVTVSADEGRKIALNPAIFLQIRQNSE